MERRRLAADLDGDDPAEGRWNFDEENREPPPKDGSNPWPAPPTSELDDLDEIPGQERAVEAIHFSTEVELAGYNLFVLGPAGTGRHALVERQVSVRAAAEPVPAAIRDSLANDLA